MKTMIERPIIPFEHIDGFPVPCPRAVIQLALSDYRNSDITDRELADYISECLFSILSKTGAVIKPVKSNEILSFRKEMDCSKD